MIDEKMLRRRELDKAIQEWISAMERLAPLLDESFTEDIKWGKNLQDFLSKAPRMMPAAIIAIIDAFQQEK